MKRFYDVIVVLYVLRMVIPIMGIIPSVAVIIMALFILYYIVCRNGLSWFSTSFFKFLPVFLSLLLLDVFGRFDEIPMIVNALYAQSILWILPFIAMDIYENKDSDLAKKLYYSISIALCITAFTTYKGCLQYPGISRQMATGRIDESIAPFVKLKNIGGFDTIYIFVLMMPFYYYQIRNKSIPLLEKAFMVLCLLVSVLAVIQSEYTTALLFTIFSILAFFLPKRKNWMQMFGYMIFILIITVIMRAFLPPIFYFISSNIDSISVQERLADIISILEGTGMSADGDAQARKALVMTGLENFASSPIWGIQKSGGGHAFITDSLSYYGLLGAILMYVLFGRVRKWLYKRYERQDCSSILILIQIVYFSFIFLNPRLYLVVLFILIPIFCYHFTYNTTRKDY